MTVEIIRQRIGTSPVTLRIDSDREKYTFSYQEKGHDPIVLGSGHNAGPVSYTHLSVPATTS